MVLLVGQRLEGRRVEGALLALEFASDGVVGDERLARTGRGAHQHVDPLVDRFDGVELEAVQAEAEPSMKRRR